MDDVVHGVRSVQTTVPLEWDCSEQELQQAQFAVRELRKVNGKPIIDVLLARPGVPPPEHYAVLRTLAGIEDDVPLYSEGDMTNG